MLSLCVVCACHHFTEVYHAPHTDARDQRTLTPLHKACVIGHIQVIKYLAEECKVDVGE